MEALAKMASVSRLGGSLSAESSVSTIAASSISPSASSGPMTDSQRKQAQHTGLIHLVTNKTEQIQRESRGRRYKNLHVKLHEAIEALADFAEEEWPPRREAIPPPPEWMAELDDHDHRDVLDGVGSELVGSTGVIPEGGEAAEEETDTDANDGGSNADVGGAEREAKKLSSVFGANVEEAPPESLQDVLKGKTAVAANGPKLAPKRDIPVAVASVEEDPATREPMHPAVVTSLHAYCLTMVHPSKTPKMVELALECVTLFVSNRYVSGLAGRRIEPTPHQQKAGAPVDPLTQMSLLQYVIESVARCSESNSDLVQAAMSKALLALMTSPKCGVHEAPMLMAVRATFHVYLVAKSPTAREVSKATLLDMLRAVFNRMEAYDAMTRKMAPEGPVAEKKTAASATTTLNGSEGTVQQQRQQQAAAEQAFSAFASQFHTDGYLLFRALCKLSAKTLPEENQSASSAGAVSSKFLQSFSSGQPVDPLALNSKILSLELILAVFERCGDAFRTGDKFIYAVQNYLCVSLLKNCMSNHTEVAFLSLRIFLLLVYKFKAHLKSEIEVFVANIFLRVLESPNSSFEQKSLVLEALRALCSDPTMLTQIFLNYDCDFDAVNLYKDMVQNLCKLSGKSRRSQVTATKVDATQDVSMSVAGLEVLVVILRSFLKALGLPGGDDDLDLGEDGRASGIRGSLKLDVGLALKEVEVKSKKDESEDDGIVPAADEVSISAEEIRNSNSEGSEEDPEDGGGSINGGGPGDVAGKIVDAFERKRDGQHKFETGVVKFTLSLKGGLLYFMENGFLRLDARDVALFFHKHKDRLDKTQIGEVLGKEPETSFVKDDGIEPDEGGEGFFVRVLYYYVDAMDFSGLMFDDAIRLFLSGFRLPGEAQKIDRIMEKFAERYTRQNEEVFPSADTAFILAFSIIMLNTDLHNPSIKPEKRMTVESFIRNNRGISVDGGDLPDAFLEGIFKRIQAQPFTLKEDDAAREKAAKETIESSLLFDSPAFFGMSAEDRKREKFRKEREEMMAASEQLFRKKPGRNKSTRAVVANQLAESVSPADVVRPMFDVTWGPLIGTLSQVLEMSDDENSIALSLIAFVYSIRVSSHSEMSLARDTFVNSLAKFTTLGSTKEMKYKNIESIRTLLSIAIMDGDFLGESWGPVLQCISQLGRLQLYASGLDSDEKFLLKDNPQDDMDPDGGGFFRHPTKAEADREIQQNNGRAVLAAVNEVLIDKVFSSTVSLSVRSIYHFIEQLIAVSEAEIAGNSKKGISDFSSKAKVLQDVSHSVARGSSGHGEEGPRIFSLQRLVEVADYNMNQRPRIAWTHMWGMMGNHFATIGCHENAMVSMFAIDALRQLSFKFLEKPELSDFNFQRIFLRPFLDIMENPGSREDIRELILRCVDNMIRSMSHNLRSGWKIFFSILTLSASDPSEKISTLGLAILQRLLDQHLEELCKLTVFEDFSGEAELSSAVDPSEMTATQRRQRNANAEDFVGLCRASLSFVQTEESEHPLPIGLSMRALCHTACYADLIADERVLPPVSGWQCDDPLAPGYTYEGLREEESLEMVLWRPILDGLAAGVCSTAPSNSGGVGCLVQRGSIMTMRAILLRHGNRFSVDQWSVILQQVILPAFQIAAEYDESQVTSITSEAPAVSSLDFLNDSLPLPPPPDDEGLRKFAIIAESEESAPSRPLGQAELLVEASFADLRHGGDGNLSHAHGLAKKNLQGKAEAEQPFPDSWVSVAAPIALGTLTDIFAELLLHYGKRGREMLWPLVLGQLQRWAIGYPLLPPILERFADDSEPDSGSHKPWMPCEALVRIGCSELNRVTHKLLNSIPVMDEEEAIAWPKTLCLNLADTLLKNVTLERMLHNELVEFKMKILGLDCSKRENGNASEAEASSLVTPFGRGEVVMERIDHILLDDGTKASVPVKIIQLENNAVLYSPQPSNPTFEDSPRARHLPVHLRSNYLEHYIPAIKIRCIASYCIQQQLPSVTDVLSHFVGEEELTALLHSLEQSRLMSRKASLDEDLAHSFQEALLSEWGGGVEEVEAALAKFGGINQRGGSGMFFLTQQAGADKAIIHLLSLLYCDKSVEKASWDAKGFAEPLLLERMLDVLKKFTESEGKDGDKIDPNVWRMSSESGGKIAIYCTSFAVVVVAILNTLLDFSLEQFDRHKSKIFPVLCSLIKVHSEEIRSLVHDVFSQQVAALAGA